MSGRKVSVAGLVAGMVSALAGCGGLANPDFSTGEVSGRLTGTVQPGAFAYALGAPQTKVAIAADGTYTVRGVPVGNGNAQLVLFNGVDRADTHAVSVKPASRAYATDRDAATLAVARTIFAAVRCTGGVSGAKATYSADGTALPAVPTGETATIFPLPPGVFTVRAQLHGLNGQPSQVDLTQVQSAQVEIEMLIDDDDDTPGCINNGCSTGLFCEADDGQCYQCVEDANCGPGGHCDLTTYVCSGDMQRPVCAGCTDASQCAGGPSGQQPLCIPPVTGTGNVCSHACTTSAECPSGDACIGNACVAAPAGCAGRLQQFGKVCLADTDCALDTPTCKKSGGGGGTTAGYCTSRCGTTADCPSGFVCDTGDMICERPED